MIDVKKYFIEIIDESRSTVGYKPLGYNINELVKEIYKQNNLITAYEQSEQEAEEIIAVLEEENDRLKNGKPLETVDMDSAFIILKLREALDEIEKLAKENVELLEGYHLEQANCLTILEIINQVKDGE